VVLTETLPAHTSFVGPTGANSWFQVGAPSEYTYNIGTVNSGAGFQVEGPPRGRPTWGRRCRA